MSVRPMHCSGTPYRDEVDPATMRRVLGHHPTGVVAVTARHDGEPVGMIVESFTSVSLRPALVGFFPDAASPAWTRIRAAGAFCANVLGEEHREVCRLFEAGDADPFAALGWEPGETGSPILDDSACWIDCRLDAVVETGDHFLALGRVVDLGVKKSTGPLISYRGGYGGFREPVAP